MPLPIAAGLAISAATQIAREFLPGLVGKITGKRGEDVARAVVEAATETTGLDPTASPDEVIRTLRASPEALIAFQSRLIEHRERLVELGNADRASARQAGTVHLQVTGKQDPIAAFLAVYAVLSFSAALAYLLTRGIPDGSREIVIYLLGQLSGYVGAVFAYKFGSSQGSKNKDDERAARLGGGHG